MIAVFVQSIRNQFIVYDCKNKLCTCQPILLIFFGNNLFCQKDDIQHFETFKTDTNYRNFIPSPKNFLNKFTPISKMTQKTANKAEIRGYAENFHPCYI
jgi:hypothetical protein